MAELTINYRDSNYRDSALSMHHGEHHHGAARVGDRAPDPTGLFRPDGTPVPPRSSGYLGLVADSADPDILRRYLDDVLRIRRRSTV